MKEKIAFSILVCFFLQSCKTVKDQQKSIYIKDFKKEFKQAAFCQCLLSGYNDRILTSKIVVIDKSYYDPVLNTIFANELKMIGDNEYSIIKDDSILSLNNSSEANAGKKVARHCLQFYESKRLDSIVNIQYKRWKSIENIDSIMLNSKTGF